MRERIATARGRLAVVAAGLDAISPLRTLERGYAIVSDAETGAVVRDAGTLRERQRIAGRVAHGEFEAIVETVRVDKLRKD